MNDENPNFPIEQDNELLYLNKPNMNNNTIYFGINNIIKEKSLLKTKLKNLTKKLLFLWIFICLNSIDKAVFGEIKKGPDNPKHSSKRIPLLDSSSDGVLR